MFPSAYGVGGAVGRKLDVSQNRKRIGRVGRSADRAFGVRQRFRGISGSY